MIPIWIKDAKDQGKLLRTDGLKTILSDTKDAATVFFIERSEDEGSNKNNADGGGRGVSWYDTVSNILIYLCHGNNIMIVMNPVSTYTRQGRQR